MKTYECRSKKRDAPHRLIDAMEPGRWYTLAELETTASLTRELLEGQINDLLRRGLVRHAEHKCVCCGHPRDVYRSVF